MAESLFSLELLVHWVRLEPALGQEEEPGQPAVAFRLLDFPTLLIRPFWQQRHPDSARLHFPFGRGKSCLFRGVPEALLGQLCRAPLYAMLLNVPSGHALPRLLGSCPLSLAEAAQELLEEMRESPLPCVRAHQGLHPLKDLLGRPVGEMSLGYRLLSLGCGLERHFVSYRQDKNNVVSLPATDNLGSLPATDNLGSLPATDNLGSLPATDNLGSLPATDNLGSPPATDNLGSQSAKAAENHDTASQEKVTMVERAVQTSSVAANVHPLEGPELKPQHPAETLDTPKVENTSAGPPRTQKEGGTVCFPHLLEKGGMTMPDRQELEIEANMFCPPPMYYSHPSSVPIENTRPPTRILDVPMASVFQESRSSEKDEERGPGEVLNPPKCGNKLNRSPPRTSTSGANLGQLPLLNALLLELSLLNQGSIGPPDYNPTIHPQLAWLYRPTNEDPKVLFAVQDKCGQKSPSPSQSKRNKSTWSPAPVTTPPPMPQTRILKGPAKVQEKKGSGPPVGQPKKKLMYGLTNTLRLRLQQTNPDMLLLHEHRERLRKQQAEAIKGKGGRPRSRGILARSPRSPPRRRRSHILHGKRGVQSSSVNENIETLIQSNRVDEQDRSTKDDHKPIHHKHSAEHVLRHLDDNIEKSHHTKNNQKPVETVQSTPLTKPLFLDSDTDLDFEHRVIAPGNYLDRQTVDSGNSQQSARTSRNSTPEHRNAEDLLENLEYTGYSDDFTSPHYTSRSSGALGGSPEPDKSQLTDSDSESHLSKPAISSKDESVSTPIPLISNASPVHSYKRTRVLVKPRSLVNAVNVSNSDPDVPEKSTHTQHAGINASNVADRLATDGDEILNIGSSQNLHDTSQSVRTSQMSSYMPSTVSDPLLSILGSDVSDPSPMEESLSDLGSPEFYKQYKPMSELVVNKLPGYTM